MHIRHRAVLLSIAVLSCTVGAEELLSTSESWDGGAIAYPDGKPQISSRILRIEPDSDIPFHCHPVPTMGYVLSGTVLVETADGRKQRFTEGSALVEVMNTLHRGKAVDGPVQIVVFYAGAVGKPNTIVPQGPDDDACDG